MPRTPQRNISYHMQNDRVARTIYIMNTIGIGEIVKEKTYIDKEGRPALYQITDTGVAIIKDPQSNMIITCYILGFNQLLWVFGNDPIPMWLKKKVNKNERYAKEQNRWNG